MAVRAIGRRWPSVKAASGAYDTYEGFSSSGTSDAPSEPDEPSELEPAAMGAMCDGTMGDANGNTGPLGHWANGNTAA
jgi:hypothetical protein